MDIRMDRSGRLWYMSDGSTTSSGVSVRIELKGIALFETCATHPVQCLILVKTSFSPW
jgi:hypothetical protein